MNVTIKLKKYLQENFGMNFEVKVMSEKLNLPLFIKNNYGFINIIYDDNKYTGVVVNWSEKMGYKDIKFLLKSLKSVDIDTEKTILVFEENSQYLRKKLIEEKVSFVVLDMQIYLPTLGMTYYKKRCKYLEMANLEKDYSFTPSEQSLVLYLIINKRNNFQINSIAKELDISSMSVSRAAKLLCARNILKRSGPSNNLLFSINGTLATVYYHAESHFINPVKKEFYISKNHYSWIEKYGILSGESLLSQISMLSEPANRVFAIEKKMWETLIIENEVEYFDNTKDKCIIVEVYSHKLIKNSENKLHHLLLFLSLKDHNDERVLKELEKIKIDIEMEINNEGTR